MFRTICGNYFFGLGPLKNRTPGGSIRGNTVVSFQINPDGLRNRNLLKMRLKSDSSTLIKSGNIGVELEV